MNHRKHCSFKALIISIVSFSACAMLYGCGLKPSSVYETPEPAPEPVAVQTPEIIEPLKVELKSSDGASIIVTEDDTDVIIGNSEFIPQLIQNYELLRAVSHIELIDGMDFTADDISDLKDAFPLAEIKYNAVINGSSIPVDAEELDLSYLSPENIDEAIRELKKLPNLQYVNLNQTGSVDEAAAAANGDKLCVPGTLDLEQVGMLQEALPDVIFDYSFILYGKTVSTADERIEYENVNIGDDGVDTVFRSIMPYLKKLNYLKLDKCEVSSETMAALRDDFPDVKVVWRVYFSSYGQTGDGTYAVYNTLTDAEKVWATGCVTDHFASELKYCTDVKYLDLGHNCITNIDFVNYMPKLEVAVLSVSWVESAAPLANCPNLEYLEIFSSHVTDITPLANCTNLKHLNISNLQSVKDISCLYDLDLERLFCTMSHIPQEQQDKFKELHPDCECEFGWVDPSKGRWRFEDGNPYNDNEDNYVPRYMLLREQFGYATFDYSK